MKIYLRTYGCQMNERDSENIAAEFAERGHDIVSDDAVADIIVVNTCSVREQAEQKAIGKLGHVLARRNARRASLPIIGVTGCMAQNRGGQLMRTLPGIDFILGARKTHMVPEIALKMYARRLEGIRHPKPPRLLRDDPESADTYLDISDDLQSHRYINRHLLADAPQTCAYISIMQGCQMNCSYCIVPKTRGIQRSRPPEEILEEAAKLVDSGTKEITLLGQVANAYGRDIGLGGDAFVGLLRSLDKLDGLERIRFTSPHPSFFTPQLTGAYAELRTLCEYVHLPLQSGSDRILKLMRRPYTASKFLEIVSRLREAKPNISISTDIIVGYPGERDEDFECTKEIFEKSGFDMAYIFKYSPRKGTLSAELPDDVPDSVKEGRNAELLDLLAKQSMEYNLRLVDTEQEILVESCAKRNPDAIMGRTRTHRKVFFKSSKNLAELRGKLIGVKIKSATVAALEGYFYDPESRL